MAAADDEVLGGLDRRARSRPRVRVAIGGAVLLVVVALVAAVATGLFGSFGSASRVPTSSLPAELTPADAESTTAPSATATPLLVHVLGAVVRPGLYELAAGSRVVDVVAAAGGFTADADQGGVNLARSVGDGEQFRVPVVGEVIAPAAGAGAGAGEQGTAAATPIDLNAANVADLDTLPRIGPALAQRIIDWRTAHGRFAAVSDLKKIAGIGDTIFAALEPLVRV